MWITYYPNRIKLIRQMYGLGILLACDPDNENGIVKESEWMWERSKKMARIVLMQYVHGMPRFCQQFVDECSCLRFLSVKLFTRSPYLSHIKWFFSPLPSIPLDSLNAKQRAPFFRYFMLLNKCVIRLWLRCDKLIQTKWFSSCHIGISLIRNTRFL